MLKQLDLPKYNFLTISQIIPNQCSEYHLAVFVFNKPTNTIANASMKGTDEMLRPVCPL